MHECSQVTHSTVEVLLRQMPNHQYTSLLPTDVLYGGPFNGIRVFGRPYLRYKDTCKRYSKTAGIDINNWENVASKGGNWRSFVKGGIWKGEKLEDREMYNGLREGITESIDLPILDLF